jgi:polygalacturonase
MKNEILVILTVGILIATTFSGCISEKEREEVSTYFTDVCEYGATGNGETLDTEAIQKAIDACTKVGSGTVCFPPGTYLSGSIHMKSNVRLYLDKDATILGAPNNINVYDSPEDNPWDAYQDFGHSHWHNSLIWGENLENIAIIGHGTINGGGMSRGDPAPGGGDKTIALKSCKNILVKDIKIEHAGHFAILPTGCDNMVIDSVNIDTNRDGINLDCCHDVVINNCKINSPLDDAIVPKSSYALGYKRLCENITIANCYVSGYDEGSLEGPRTGGGGTGRIKFGTESNGGFKNVTVDNCIFDNCWGLALEIVDGGIMDNLTISNIVMKNVTVPIFIRLGNRSRGPKSPPVGKIQNISISNFTAIDADERYGSIISGVPSYPIGENIRLENISITYKGGGKKILSCVRVPEKEKDYPEPNMFGIMPSYGFYCRHVRGIEFHNVTVGFDKPDRRPALICEDIDGLTLDGFKAERAFKSEPPIILNNVKNVFIHDSLDIPM